jgi:hypothetical protein
MSPDAEVLIFSAIRHCWECRDCDGYGIHWKTGIAKSCDKCYIMHQFVTGNSHGNGKDGLSLGVMMSIYSRPGTKVRFVFGTAGQASDVKQARKILLLGQVYTVKHVDVHSSSSSVEFEEISGEMFNTVMFARVEHRLSDPGRQGVDEIHLNAG